MRVNGALCEGVEGMTLAQFIAEKGYDSTRVACELNGEIVGRICRETCLLAESDSLEIVHFVGGG